MSEIKVRLLWMLNNIEDISDILICEECTTCPPEDGVCLQCLPSPTRAEKE